ncbi:MAG: hypothetical protein C0631_18325 [Sedimenticola sp.]|nr:MAG: hypothetical protein C0631_18325 [Sedimenticola sp.]
MLDPFDGVLDCHGEFPIAWEVACVYTDYDCSVANHRNERLLGLLHSLEDVRKDSYDETYESNANLARVEAKLDLLLDLVSELLTTESADLKPCSLRLSSRGAEWMGESTDLQPSQQVWLSLGLDPKLPRPLKLLAEVVNVFREPGGLRMLLAFKLQSELVTDLLEKAIFRYHRRQIASQKSVNP